MGPTLLLWLSLSALAEDFRAWQGVHEGLLIESADGDLVAAARWYESLIASVPDNDPARAELYYQLGRARYALGDVPGAQAALAVAQADPLLEERASVLLDQIEAQKNPIRSLPYLMDLSQPSFPWRRAWSRDDRAGLDVVILGDSNDRALAWHTVIESQDNDQIELRFAEGADQPREIVLTMRTSDFPAWLLVVAIDDKGRAYTSPNLVEVPVEDWSRVSIAPQEMTPFVSGEGASSPPRPTSVRALILRDVTSSWSSDRGPNHLYVGGTEVR